MTLTSSFGFHQSETDTHSCPALTIWSSPPSTSSLPLSHAVIFLYYLKATKDQALERHFNLLTGLWKAPPVRFGCCGTVNGVYLLNGKREPQHRSHLRKKMAVDIRAGTEH